MKTMPVTGTQFDLLVEEGADLGAFFEDAPIPDHIVDTPEALLEFIATEHADLALPAIPLGTGDVFGAWISGADLKLGGTGVLADFDIAVRKSQRKPSKNFIKHAERIAKSFNAAPRKKKPSVMRDEYLTAALAGYVAPPSGRSAKK
ncbi:hypothetical protein [Paracoccus sp. SY]|uniref:hypothetical protein n=1 Tax=Paracoccus sp. SY TaxID=1330255 RepID=UPI0011AEC439|nr:hypothetical protein [Paracoccus sp. SY]